MRDEAYVLPHGYSVRLAVTEERIYDPREGRKGEYGGRWVPEKSLILYGGIRYRPIKVNAKENDGKPVAYTIQAGRRVVASWSGGTPRKAEVQRIATLDSLINNSSSDEERRIRIRELAEEFRR